MRRMPLIECLLTALLFTSPLPAQVCDPAIPCDAMMPGDFDQDGDVDGDDHALFEACASGAEVDVAPGCAYADLDEDGDGDQSDFGLFQALLIGACDCPPLIAEPPNGQPGNPMRSTYLFSGEFHESAVDLVIPGRGIGFAWARKYRSRIGPDTGMGHGWDHSYNVRVEAAGPHLRLHDGNTRRDVYRLQADGTWARPEFFNVLSQNRGGTYTLMFPDTGQWTFNPLDGSPAEGRIASMADRNGNTMTFEYDPLGRLAVIHDPLDTPAHNRDITIAYNGDGRISSVTDFIGRQVRYAYYQPGEPGGSPGDLKSVSTPEVIGTPIGNDFPLGKTTTYAYTTGFADDRLNHNLRSITDPKGQTYLQNEYAATTNPNDLDFDRVIRQTWGDPGDVLDVVYVPQTPDPGNSFAVMLAIVNDRMGNVSHWAYDKSHRLVRARRHTGRADPDQLTTLTTNLPRNPLRPTDPPFFETRYNYNGDSLLTLVVDANGNEEQFVHDEANPDPRSRGNLLQHCMEAGPLGGDQAMICESYEYDPIINHDTNQVTRHTDPRGHETLYEYDLAGNRTHTTHRIPTIVEDFEYNGFGQMTAHVHPDNGSGHRRRDEFTYYTGGPSMGYLHQTIVDAGPQGPFNLTTTLEYDAVGNVTRSVDPRGSDTLCTYNSLNQRVKTESRPVVLPVGTQRYEQTYFYDGNDNLVRSCRENLDDQGLLDPSNGYMTTIMEYDVLDDLIRSCEESGSFNVPLSPPQLDCTGLPESEFITTEYEYDDNRNRTRIRYGEAVEGRQPDNEIVRLYDERDLRFQETWAPSDPGHATSQYDYDANGNLFREHEGLESNPRIATYVYDGYDRLTAATDPMGNVTTYTYDANSNRGKRLTKAELIDDLASSTGNVRQEEETFVYDSMDRTTRIITEHFDPATQAPIGDGQSIARFIYTASGHLLSFEDDNGNTTTITYDTASRKHVATDAKGNSTTYEYDPNGNVTAVVEVDESDLGNPDETFVMAYAYDALDRIIQSTDNVGNVDQHHYDSRDNLTRTVDALGNVARYAYDGADRLVGTERDLTDSGTGTGTVVGTITTAQAWDDSHRRVTETDDSGHTVTHVYDALDREITTEYADCTTETGVYDVHDNEVQTTDANGTVSTYTYDLLNRLTASTYVPGAGVSSDTLSEAFTYDGLSRPRIAQDDDSTDTFDYDSLSNVLSQNQNGQVTASTYDGVGNKLTCTYPGGRVVAYVYDALHRIIRTEDGLGNVHGTYDFIGHRMERMDYENNTAVEYAYDGEGNPSIPNPPGDFGVRQRIRTHHFVVGGPDIDHRTYKWDPLYNKTQRVDVTPGHVPATHDYAYDSTYRLTQTTVSAPPPLGTLRDTDYIEDDAYNRIEVFENGVPEPYSRNPALCEPGDFQMNQYTTIGPENRLYDLNGNLTTRLQGPPQQVLQFDVHNQLVVHTNPTTGVTTTFTHDAFGRRLSKTVQGTGPAQTTQYLWGDDPNAHCNRWQVLEERDGGGALLRQYTYGGGLDDVVHMRAGANDYFYHPDDLGNVMALTNAAGNLVEYYEYDDYGEPEFFSGAGNQIPASLIGNAYLFNARRYDPETGFYYFRSRYLDPAAGRFISRDPLGLWGDPENAGNPYAYVGNNPWTHTDPMGMAKENFVRNKPHVNVGSKPKETVVIGSKVKEVIKEAGLRSDGELVQAVSDAAHAAIAIPNLLEARKGANESAAISSLRTLVSSQSMFSAPGHRGRGESMGFGFVTMSDAEPAQAHGPMPQTREHILLARQGGSSSSDKRKQSLYFPEEMLDDRRWRILGNVGSPPAVAAGPAPVPTAVNPVLLSAGSLMVVQGGMGAGTYTRKNMSIVLCDNSNPAAGSLEIGALKAGASEVLMEVRGWDPAQKKQIIGKADSRRHHGDSSQHEVGHWLGLYHGAHAPGTPRKRPGPMKWPDITLKKGW